MSKTPIISSERNSPPPHNKFNKHAVDKEHFNVQSMLKNYKCFHLTQSIPVVITPGHAIDNW